MPTGAYRVTAYDWVPRFARGLVRDLRVRWALEEAGLPYEIDLLPQGEQKSPAHRKRQPFGQVPVLDIGDGQESRTMFESGAIVLRIAEESGTLLPSDPAGRDETLSWIFAALNTVEPPIYSLATLIFAPSGPTSEAAETLRPWLRSMVAERLGDLSAALGDREYLTGGFTAADILMVTVLNNLRGTGLVEEHPVLVAYLSRATGRPAYQRALAGQLAAIDENAPRYRKAG